MIKEIEVEKNLIIMENYTNSHIRYIIFSINFFRQFNLDLIIKYK